MKVLGQNIKKEQLLVESRKLVSISRMRRRILFWGGGILVGLVCVLFAFLCDNMNTEFDRLVQQYPYMPFAVTPIGFMLIVYIMRTMFKGSEGSGIPQVMAALQIKNYRKRSGLVSMRIALGKFILTFMGFMCGASIGREGPTIQLSASIMHQLGRIGKFHRDDVERGLLLAGGAAGIAAAFNAPLAGIVFAIEELAGSYEKGVSGTIITTVVLSGFVAMELLGSYTYFGASHAALDILGDGWIIIGVTTLCGGFLGGAFSALLLSISKHMVDVVRKHPLWVAGLLGFIVAAIGFFTHGQTYGSGYEAAKILLSGSTEEIAPFYGFFKMISTLLSYLSGIPGGIFAPSLSAGAGLGATIAQFFSPEYLSAIILLTTVAYFSGVVQSPITCFIIVSEMTDTATTSMLLPIMLTSLMATGVSRVICRESIYHVLSSRFIQMLQARPSY